jgi:hypothetical protein
VIDADRVVGLQSLADLRDQRVGGIDDAAARSVVLDQILDAGGVVCLEAADELVAGVPPGIDVSAPA